MRVLLILCALLLTLTPQPTPVDPADIIFVNGNIYTVNDREPKAESVAVKKGRIIFVGSSKDAQKYISKETRVIDLHGNTMLPGLTDAHHHLSGVGFREMTLNLEGTTSLDDFLAKVKARVDQAKPNEWVIGRGWIDDLLETRGVSYASGSGQDLAKQSRISYSRGWTWRGG